MFGEKNEKFIVKADGDFPELRKMNRGQVIEFNKKGLNPLRNKVMLDHRNQLNDNNVASETAIAILNLNDEMETWILDNVYKEYDFNSADFQACSVLAAETYKITFFPEQNEIKNS